jgi:GT2 family glycosyltransferase
MKVHFSHDVIICTSKRNETLFETIHSLDLHKHHRYLKLYVVVNGYDENLISQLEKALKESLPTAIVIRSEPGLVSARNLALKESSSEIVTFLDDDVTLGEDFFRNLDDQFSKHPAVIGMSPRIKYLYLDRPLSKIITRFRFLQKSNLPRKVFNFGRLTSWARNNWFPDIEIESQICDWLPGCCMSFRRDSIKGIFFNSNLQNGPTGGYALGEDADFSMRVNSRGILLLNSTSVILHRQAPSVRDDLVKMEEARGYWNSYLVRNFPERFSLIRIFIYNLFRICVKWVKKPTEIIKFKGAFAFFMGFFAERRHEHLGRIPKT